MIKTFEMTECNDAMLVTESLAGNREAFGKIVARYQNLICSLAYSATGSLSQSEDIAQETFLTAWKQLAKLREPQRLRSWLCGIARNLTCDALKRQGREPSHAAESLEELHESSAPDPLPTDFAISKEEETILWRAVEHIPEIYREPLVLFYREHQSVEAVANQLELTEDAVKQRLSRGRKLLHEQVLAFVEGALGRTAPGKVFTFAVLGALPSLTISAKAATLGATAAKGSAVAKAAGVMGLLGALLSPFISFFGMWLGYRMTQEAALTDRERAFNKKFYKRLTGCIGGFVVVYGALMFCGKSLLTFSPKLFVGLTIGVASIYLIAIGFYSRWANAQRKRMLAELTSAEIATRPGKAVWEFRSQFTILGLPFIHLRLGDRLAPPVKAWIAIGDSAFGILFAFGGLAIAPVSIGGCAVGLFSFGGLAIGALVLGGMALGGWAFGGLAIGWQAFGGCAIAWNAAWGGYGIARDFALGGLSYAAQANNGPAADFLRSQSFFRISEKLFPYLLWMNLIWIIPMFIQRRVLAWKRREAAQQCNFAK